jgi:hypothetical protein
MTTSLPRSILSLSYPLDIAFEAALPSKLSYSTPTPKMPPLVVQLLRRKFDPSVPSSEFYQQWRHPSDVFSVLLILGGDVVGRALAQLAGSPVTPVAFSFGMSSTLGLNISTRASPRRKCPLADHLVIHPLGWVAYAVTAVVSAIGENKLMPLPDCACKVINGRTGYVRDNSSWVIGRVMRDFESWMDQGKPQGPISTRLLEIRKAKEKDVGSGQHVSMPSRTGLCVSIYKAELARPGYPGYNGLYFIGFVTSIVQLGIAAIPCSIYGNWGILLVTASGIILSFATGSISQWSKEKWACRRNSEKTVILTRGSGSQHAIVIIGDGKGLDLEDLAAGPTNVDVSASYTTRIAMIILAALWILILITAAGIKQNTWFLLPIGGIGMLDNILVAGWRRFPKDFGMRLTFENVIGELKVMDTLFAVEEAYPRVGRSMLKTFFPGRLRTKEKERWDDYEQLANTLDESKNIARGNTQIQSTQANTNSNNSQANGTGRPGEARRGGEDASRDAGTEGESVGKGAPGHADEHGEPGVDVLESGTMDRG